MLMTEVPEHILRHIIEMSSTVIMACCYSYHKLLETMFTSIASSAAIALIADPN